MVVEVMTEVVMVVNDNPGDGKVVVVITDSRYYGDDCGKCRWWW